MITPSSPQRRRSRRVPRSLPRRRVIPEPISSAYAGFFGGAGFYLRVGMLAAVALSAFGILALRLWSLQVLQGPRYTHLAQKQTFRYVDLPAPRAPIVDAKVFMLAGTSGRLVLAADAGSPRSRTPTWPRSCSGSAAAGCARPTRLRSSSRT